MMARRRLRAGLYRCPRCKREVTLLVASVALCLPCGRAMKRVEAHGRHGSG